MKFGVGQSVPRKEDPRLVTGGGEFTDDINLPNQLYLRVLRSPFAHGKITTLDTSDAESAAGVVAVYTAADLHELGALPCRAVLKNPDGSNAFIPRRAVLAEDKVCFVGQAVAAVVATSPQEAEDALEHIQFDVEMLPANADTSQALHPDAPIIHEAHGSNLCVHFDNGQGAEVSQALTEAAHIVEVSLVNNRVAPSPLEPRACIGQYVDNQYVLHNPSQGVFAQQGVLSKAVFKVDVEQMRVISPDTGGGFGIRGEIHSEAVLCLFAAKELDQPVKYTGTRAEMFMADNHGRDNVTHVTGGMDTEGKLLSLRVETIANIGAYCTAVGPFVPTMAGGRIVGTVYAIPHVHHSVKPVFTNSMPVGAYRGAGRPEACYVMERFFDAAAAQIGIDGITLRKRNFVSVQQQPYKMPSGVNLEGGNFDETLELGLESSDWQGFEKRKSQSQACGKLRGIGLGFYVESSGGGPEEEAHISVNDDGSVDVTVGTFSHGQGHRTTYSQVLSEILGIDFDKINIIQGDSQTVKFGGGTGGSRSSQMGSIAAQQACVAMLDDAASIAAEILQSEKQDVSYTEGKFESSSNGSHATLAQVAVAAKEPQFGGQGLTKTHRYNRGSGFTFPNGAHVAEVEIDPETGVVEVVRYTATDDCGRVINPLLAGGQVHGGVVQGIGQTLYEEVVYDPDGQLTTGTLMDYTLPRASQVPDVDVHFNEVLDPNNELGVKGIGEGGACGAPPAIVNAVLDALKERGVRQIDMPLTPEKVWRAINA